MKRVATAILLAVFSIPLSQAGPRGYSLEELDAAALVLRTAVDGDQRCGLSAKEAETLLAPLHYRIDRKLEQERKNLPLKGDRLSRAQKCEKTCHCGIYSSLLETPSGEPRAQSELHQQLEKKAMKQSRAQSSQCASRQKWFCGSNLLKFLKREAPNSGE